MNIFVIASVRGASQIFRERLEKYVKSLEDEGHNVHLPHRDTDQETRGFDICQQNFLAIRYADRVDIFYSSESQGTHFDMGMVFALYMLKGKKIKIVENEDYGEGKSYPRMLDEWQEEYTKNYQVLTFRDPSTGKYFMQNFYHFNKDKHSIEVVIRKSDARIFGIGTYVRFDTKRDKIKNIWIPDDSNDKDLYVSFENAKDVKKLSDLIYENIPE